VSIAAQQERRLLEGTKQRPLPLTENLMAYPNRLQNPEIELWNVSLLPTIRHVAGPTPPRGPAPVGGSSLPTPALLSVAEAAAATTLAQAA
jgi:hypothetical protein